LRGFCSEGIAKNELEHRNRDQSILDSLQRFACEKLETHRSPPGKAELITSAGGTIDAENE
jgi:hypothetical protein